MQIACDNQQSTGVRFKPCFDSRTRMGATYSSSNQKEESIVLIRVPAQSATLCAPWGRPSVHDFDSRTRAGCDMYRDIAAWLDFNFDSRTRAGCDSIYCATRQLKAQHVCFDNTILLWDCIDTSQDKCEETSTFLFAVPSHSEQRW